MVLPVYRAPTKAITIKGSASALVVRGVSFEDIALLVHEHLPEITQAVEQYRSSMTDVYSERSMDGFLGSLLRGFPMLAAHLIAHAADAPDEADTIRGYPAGTQVVALAAVAELTLEDASGLPDPSPALGSALKAMLGALSGPKSPSPVSIGLSDAP